MAVWLYALGKNKSLADSEFSNEDYVRILNDIELDAHRIFESIKEVSGQLPEQPSQITASYKWELIDDSFYACRIGYNSVYDGMRMILLNDLILLYGPRDVFSLHGNFLNVISNSSREYYHSYFKQILRAFGSDFILYSHEWAGLFADDDKGFNYTMLKKESAWIGKCSDSIHTMGNYYYEELQPLTMK
ncbi:MAG TPA: hypothetical protein VK154_11800 [Chitinophagales bacterium]|nr:hypothetical protein [Chitinophagales bacterium]